MNNNIFLDKINNLCLDNKYSKWYFNIINTAINCSVKNEGYVEKHHILPKSFNMGGVKDKQNIVILTAKQHYIAHLCLTKMFENSLLRQKTAFCFLSMSRKNKNQQQRHTGRVYESLKKQAFEFKQSPQYRQRMSEVTKKNHQLGIVGNYKPHTEETKHKISLATKGRINKSPTDEVRKRLSDNNKGSGNPMFGRKHSDEVIKRLSQMSLSRPKILCVVCNKQVDKGNFKRWHSH